MMTEHCLPCGREPMWVCVCCDPQAPFRYAEHLWWPQALVCASRENDSSSGSVPHASQPSATHSPPRLLSENGDLQLNKGKQQKDLFGLVLAQKTSPVFFL